MTENNQRKFKMEVTKPNPFVGACHIPDPLNEGYCILCGKKMNYESKNDYRF